METKTVGSGRRLIVGENEYLVDSGGFLLDTTTWDAAFAEGMAAEDGLPGGLTERHWDVIRFIRRYWAEVGSCPTVYTTCRALGLHVSGFRFLFPRGYQRGACRLAGISMRTAPPEEVDEAPDPVHRSYRIDIWGFLLDPDEWDDRFALLKAHEMKVPGGLTTRHWEVLRFLRAEYGRTQRIPTVCESCDALGMTLEELEDLFPDGYHRGAVKIAGLRLPTGSGEAGRGGE